MKQRLYQFAFKLVPKEAEKLGELCPPNPLAASLLYMALRRTRATKSCGVRGSHFPALFDYFNLERNFVLERKART